MRARMFVAVALVVGCADRDLERGPVGAVCEARQTTLTGTWDITTGPTAKAFGTIDVQPTYIAVFAKRFTLFMRDDGTGSFDVDVRGFDRFDFSTGVRVTEYGEATRATRTAARALDSGDLPFALGGTWEIADPGTDPTRICAADVSSDVVEVRCGAAYKPGYLDDVFPIGPNTTATFTRTSALPSIFGSLGGEWTYARDGGPACAISLRDASLNVSCTLPSGRVSSVELTFGDGVISGQSSEGGEIVAIRR